MLKSNAVKNGLDLKLNKEQLEAIRFKTGPLLIIAGAGTGKTTVITERIKHLISKNLAAPSEILALTFTEKAASEMESRVDLAMPYGYTSMWISTFHSFCDRVLRDSALNIGLDPRYKLMSEAESMQLIRNNLFKFDLDYFRPLGNPTKFVGGLLQHFSRLQDEDVSPSDYVRWVHAQGARRKAQSEEEKIEIEKWQELAGAYKTYDDLKVKEGVLDFGDLISKTLELFRKRKNVLKTYLDQFKYVLVDEFQDTNFAQNELAILLAGKNKNITVCGDDDQSIYRFRGAAVSNIIQFRKNFPKAKTVVLTKNYRNTQEILDRAYDLIQRNNPDRLEIKERVSKKLIAQNHVLGREIRFIHTDRVENEAEEVAKEIKKLIASPSSHKTSEGMALNYNDIAILVRANNHSEPFGRALSRHGIPYQFLGPGRLFKQPEIVDLVSYLKVLYNFEDSVALYRILSLDYFDIPPRDLVSIGIFARKRYLSLFEACERIEEIFVGSATKEKIKKILEIINRHFKLTRRETAGQLLYYFLENTGLLHKLLSPETPEAEKKAINISKFFDKLKSYEVNHEDATVPAVVDWLELSSELGESPLAADIDWTEVNAVNILTVHSSKGLEFPVVFLTNLVTQRFPSTERREQIPIPEQIIKEVLPVGDYHLEEERRLFYVGMTRAKDLLYFTAADYYGEGKRERSLSPFIFEALGDKVVASEMRLAMGEKAKQLSFMDYQAADQMENARLPARQGKLKMENKVHIDYLSYSQIETFRTCPLHYKLKYIYNVPTPPSPSQSFGTSIHAALKKFYDLIKAGEVPARILKSNRNLGKLVFKCLQDTWIKEGYGGRDHEKKFFEKGKFYLSGYLEEEFNPNIIPVATEEKFTLPLSSQDKKERFLRIAGKVDRIDEHPGGLIEIIDYKTGATIPTQRDVDKNLQLSFYALAATKIPQAPFNRKPEKIQMSLYFLDIQEKIVTTRTQEELDKAVEEIFKVREEIENSDFKCSNHLFCQKGCEYSLFCKSEQ